MIKPIVINGAATEYLVSDNGEVFNKNGKPLKQEILKKGYKRIKIKGKGYVIHRLVALAFIPNPENKPQVNHKDGNTGNNCAWNLEWATQSENMGHKFHVLKSKNHMRKLSDSDIPDICLRFNNGESCESISNSYGVGKTSIMKIIQGKTYIYSSIPITRKGHEQNHSKIKPNQVKEIRSLYANGLAIDILCSQYSLHRTTIYKIITRQTWRNI